MTSTPTPIADDYNHKPVVVLGAGGHARVLISLLRLIGRPIAALLDNDPAKQGQAIDGLTVTGSFDALDQHSPAAVELVNAIGSAGRPEVRQRVYEQWTAKGYAFATLAHPSAVIAPEAHIEAGAQVMALAAVQPGARLGSNCLINTKASIDHDTAIGAHSHVAPGATVCGGVTIGAGCHIGAGATVVQGIAIGQGSVVGAGATVVKDVAAGQVVAGTPAKPLSR